jgi:PAS domain S-box-containing protein
MERGRKAEMSSVKDNMNGLNKARKNPAKSRLGEPSLRYRVQFENLVTEISTQFINLPAEELDHGIQQVLQKVGKFAKVDRSYVFLLKNGHGNNTYEWCARGIPSQKGKLQGLLYQSYPWSMAKLHQSEDIDIPRLHDLPPEARAERELLENLHIKSLVAVPMILHNSLLGFLGFDSVRREKIWSEGTLFLLKIVGEIFVNAVERKRTEEGLKESEKKYRQLVDNSLLGIYIIQNYVLKFCNQTFAEMFGYDKPDELTGIRLLQLVAPEDRELVNTELKTRISGNKTAPHYEFRAVRKDGTVFDAEVLGARIIFEGQPAIQGTILDITERKRAEESLKEKENKYRALFEGVPVGLYRTTPEGKILDLNPTMVQMLGHPDRDSVLGKNAAEFYLDKKDRDRFTAILAQEKVLRNFEFQLKRADGKVIWAQDNVHAVFDSKGQVLHYEGSLLDIARQKQDEEAVQNRSNQVIRHQAALLELAKLEFSDLDSALKTITEIQAWTLDVDRVSVWLFNPEHTAIICHDLFQKTQNTHSKSMVLEARQYPRYFRALEGSCVIAADDTFIDPRTNEFAESYLRPQKIVSMMDIPIRLHGQVTGVVCHEHTGMMRKWTLEEQQYAISSGDIVALALEASERKRMEKVNESILKISEATNSSKNLDELFRSIHQVISSLMPANNFYIALYDPVQHLLSFPYFVDEYDQAPAPKPLGKGLTEHVLRTGKPLLASPEVFAQLEKKSEVESIGAPSIDWLGVPLITDGKTIGVLVVQTYTEGVRYREEEKNILKFVSNQVAMAVDRKKNEEEVQERERFLSSIFESIQDGMSILDQEYNIIRVNPAIEKWYAHAMPLIGKKCYEAYHLRDSRCSVCPTRTTLKTSQAAYEVVPKIGTGGEVTGWLDLYSFPLMDQKTGQMKGVIEYVRDISERKKAEDKLQSSLSEKEVLLREIHHRVKNNMQVISSLLNLQSRHISDPYVLDIFRESQRRIRSMALIHERLYQSSDLSRIEFSQYLHNLATHLFHSYQVDSNRIRLTMDSEEVFLNINTAIPCGLIVNELVSNALKHAFPDGRNGELAIELHRVAGEGFMLRVRDDGVGFPEGLDFQRTATLGMQIVITLVNQIDASIELQREKGTEFKILFQEVKYRQRT